MVPQCARSRYAACIAACLSLAMATGCARLNLRSPPSATFMEVLNLEMRTGLAARGVQEKFARYQAYSDARLDASAGVKTGSEKAGNCRLSWYDQLMRDQLHSPTEAELFTRKLHAAITPRKRGLTRGLDLAAARLGLRPNQDAPRARAAHRRRGLGRDRDGPCPGSAVSPQRAFAIGCGTAERA